MHLKFSLIALGHLAFSPGHNSDGSWMGQKILKDANCVEHRGISKQVFIVLKVDEQEIKKIIRKARNENILLGDFPQEMFDTVEELVRAIAHTHEFDYSECPWV
ncbi:MAG: hypothetical protein MAG795_00371 [Candidatus Woesearchaeota archaeon]|nr:hypothetical protein [Candidatus Woesearchaeota archaeon]